MSEKLLAFCDPTDELLRWCDLHAPVVVDGYLYATDGRVCVREPTTEAEDQNFPKSRILSVTRIFTAVSYTDPWPKHPGTTKAIPCDSCGGTGKADETCPDCDGEGSTECDACHQDVECERCDGDGTIPGKEPCERCGGETLLTVPADVMVAGRLISGRYAQMIEALGGVRYCPDGKPDDVLQFACGEIEGIVMPMAGSKS